LREDEVMDASRPGSLLIDRAVGTVIGGAIGDALGAGYEFAVAPEPDDVTMLRGTVTEQPAGHWTDDTAMAIAILEVAARMGTLATPAATVAVGERFLEWFHSGPPDVGIHTREVLLRAASGAHVAEAAAEVQRGNPNSAGNGSLMRTGPVALVHRGDDEELVIAATAMSELTHPHPDAVAACILWTVAIDRAIANGTLEGPRAGLHLIDESRRAFWEQKISDAETNDPRGFSPNGHVVVALQAAWSAVHATRNSNDHFVAGLRRAVSIGDDTDTVAAIAGCLLGACYGFGAAPLEWSSGLAGWPATYGVDDLVQLATSAVELGVVDADE
jgi:ADP-ribosylglycohydrolase